MIRRFSVFAILLLSAIAVHAQTFQSGRFEFVTNSGDTTAQLASGQSTLSTYLILNGTQITNNAAITTDTYLDDTVNYNNDVITGSTSNGGRNVSLKLVITNSASNKVTINFSGSLSTYTSHGADATIISGTFTSNGTYTANGTFTATYFPPFTGSTYSGSLDAPDSGSGPVAVPASFTIATGSNGALTITNFTVSAPLASCFVGPFHEIADPNFPLFITSASGMGLNIYLQDTKGTTIWLNAYSILGNNDSDGNPVPAALDEKVGDGTNYPSSGLGNLGTNSTYEVFYGISGGSCDGFGGGDSPFQAVPEKGKKHDKPRHEHGRDRR